MLLSVLFVLPLLFAVWVSWYLWRLHRRTEEAGLLFLEKEKTKPRYAVWFVTHDGQTLKSKTINPTKYWTSEKLAEMYMEDYFHKTYFTCEQGISYPACNIKKAWVGEVKNDRQN